MNLSLVRELADDWPGSCVVRNIAIASPAVATDFNVTVPGEAVWIPFAMQATLVTDANVATRHPDFTVTDGSATLFRVPLGVGITAGLTTIVSWLPRLGYASTAILGNRLTVGVPDVALMTGWTVGVAGSALQAGDQWSAISLQVVEVYHGHIEAEREIATRWNDKLEAIHAFITGAVS